MNLTEGQLVEASKHIIIQRKKGITVISETTLFETTDSVKELVSKTKEYLGQGIHFNSGLYTYLTSQGVKLPKRKANLSSKNSEVPPIIIHEGLPAYSAKPVKFDLTPNMGMVKEPTTTV
jgi:hypothetical protein